MSNANSQRAAHYARQTYTGHNNHEIKSSDSQRGDVAMALTIAMELIQEHIDKHVTAAAASASQQGDVDWVCELEAALSTLDKLRAKSWNAGKRMIWSDATDAWITLNNAANRERSRSGADERPAPAKED